MGFERKEKGMFAHLTPEQRDAIFEHGESHELKDTLAWLRAEFDIDPSKSRLSDWLKKERKERAFRARLVDLRASSQQSELVAKSVGNLAGLNHANVALLSQALYEAQISNDGASKKQAAILLSMMIEACAKDKKADADVANAKTSRDKFEFDAAKAALAHAKDLKTIAANPKMSEKEKIALVRERLFGRGPSTDELGQTQTRTEVAA